nr:MAG TPA: hypothetical protein [Bacteriophage sp.]
MFKKCLNLSFFEGSFPAKNWKPYPIFFQHLVLPIKYLCHKFKRWKIKHL